MLHVERRVSCPPMSLSMAQIKTFQTKSGAKKLVYHIRKWIFFQMTSSTLEPMVGDVWTTSFMRNWYSMVVLPALSRPTIIILCSSLLNMLHSFENKNPMIQQNKWREWSLPFEPMHWSRFFNFSKFYF